jgi:Tfp pilus assembly protein PilF
VFGRPPRRARALFPLWAFLPVYTAGVVLFFVNARYRVPVLPVLVLFGAYALVWALDAWRAGRRGAVTGLALAALAVGVWARAVPPEINQSEAYGRWQLGVFEAQHGDPAAAAKEFEAAIAEWPRRAVFHKDLAVARKTLGDRRGARESIGRALELSPDDPASLGVLFELELEEGRLAEARAIAERMRERLPQFATGLYDLGRVAVVEADQAAGAGTTAVARAKREQALEAFERCSTETASSDAFACAYGAGLLLGQLGRPGEAVARFERSIALLGGPDRDGWFWRAQAACLEALQASGRAAEASARAEDLARRYPNDPRALALRQR